MKVSNSDQQGDIGVYSVGLKFTEELNWIFRPQPSRDYGIDAIVEIVINGETKGQLLAMQIKSGTSWLSESDETKIVFRSDKQHLEYWKNYPLPVIVVINDPESKNAYWQIVNKHSVEEAEKGWKLEIPKVQLINSANKANIAQFCDFVLSTDDFSVLSLKDVSHAGAKRYSVDLLLNKTISKGELTQLVVAATDDFKKREYYRNQIVEARWAGQSAQVIWLFVYTTPENAKNTNWVCRSQWINPHLVDGAKPIKLKGVTIGNNLILDWSESHDFLTTLRKEREVTKEEFLTSAISILNPTIEIIEKVSQLSNKYFDKEISFQSYSDSMTECAKVITDLYFKAGDIGIAPLECKDFSERFDSLMATAHNIVLPYSDIGRNSWTNEQKDSLVKQYLRYYEKDIQRLQYELEKIK